MIFDTFSLYIVKAVTRVLHDYCALPRRQ